MGQEIDKNNNIYIIFKFYYYYARMPERSSLKSFALLGSNGIGLGPIGLVPTGVQILSCA